MSEEDLPFPYQLVTNNKFRSVEHRVLANKAGQRVSIARFYSMNSAIS